MPRIGDGRKNHPLYSRWVGMRQRCNDSNTGRYHRYGGRGISIDPTWSDFWQFVQDVGLPPGPGYSLDRIDNDGNYEPSNVRWATSSEQNLNRSKPAEKPMPERCIHGHVYVPKYVKKKKNGVSRYCLECVQGWRAAYAERRRQDHGWSRRNGIPRIDSGAGT